MHAEAAYLFRHALLRDAAYELQLPADRARLHALAFYLIEEAFGGPGPPLSLGTRVADELAAHDTDAVAAELADHALLAAGSEGGALADAGLDYLCRAALHAERGYRFQEALDCWLRAAHLVPDAARGDFMRRAGSAALRLARSADSERYLRTAIQLALQAGDQRAEGVARGALCALFSSVGRLDEGAHEGAAALPLLREAGERRVEGATISALANRHVALREYDRGYALNLKALAIFREVGYARGEAAVIVNLGNLRNFQKRWQEAEQFDRQALELARKARQPEIEAQALVNLGEVHERTSRIELAEQYLRQAIAVARTTGQPGILASHYSDFGSFLMRRRRPQEAESCFRAAVASNRETGDRTCVANESCKLANCLVACGKVDEARAIWAEHFAVIRKHDPRAAVDHLVSTMREACAKAGVPPFE